MSISTQNICKFEQSAIAKRKEESNMDRRCEKEGEGQSTQKGGFTLILHNPAIQRKTEESGISKKY